METRLGIFNSRSAAEQALDLVSRDIPRESLFLLSSQEFENAPAAWGSSKVNTESQPGSESKGGSEEPPGTGKGPTGAGKASGQVIGATIGSTAGFTAGATIATLMVPGLGMIFAIGLGAAALLGLGGAAAGAGVGNEIEKNVDMGIPQEDVAFYRQLLREGKSLVVVKVRAGSEIAMLQEAFRNRGGEDVDAAQQRRIIKAA